MLNQALYSEEELGLFNSAYTGFILYSSISEFVVFKPEGIHCALPFILLPMSMNQLISSQLPSTYKTPIGSWVASNEGVLSSLHEQAESYHSIVRSSIRFLLDRNLISITDDGCFLLNAGELPKNPALFNKSRDMKGSLRSARFLGKWFSHAPSVETIFAQLGLRP
tara:strand:+ start:317 stop:814 length:498 start_codon:yes stop_codon:yes gene_type:complete